MTKQTPQQLSPVTFLQAFITQTMRLAEQHPPAHETNQKGYIECVGLAASRCLEDTAKQSLGLSETIDPDRYAEIIINIKNRIGGKFSRASGEAGVVRVLNTQCPFGESVKEAPELCKMTSSVFGGIAARNFGYGKVALMKRIATGDSTCEVCIYTDRELAKDKEGDEYVCDGGAIISRTASAEVTSRVEEKLRKVWCASGGRSSRNLRHGPTIVAESAAMRAALEAVEVVAPTCASVVVTGETGTGKEIVARAIHAFSDRAEKPLLAVNCSAIPENLVESALFGHEKGAFTDAYNVHHGFFERADTGTLFLDEIDSLPVSAQAQLLRVLQEGDFERVGGRQTLRTDVRIIAASSRNLSRMVEAKEFRRDLYYRLNVVPIHLPPLRERRDDAVGLVNHFLRTLKHRYHKPNKILSDNAWTTILSYHWPGNVRELENVLERAFLFSRGTMIDELPVEPVASLVTSSTRDSFRLREAKKRAALDIEGEIIRNALIRFQGNVTQVAQQMGITPRALHMKIRFHDINTASYRTLREAHDST